MTTPTTPITELDLAGHRVPFGRDGGHRLVPDEETQLLDLLERRLAPVADRAVWVRTRIEEHEQHDDAHRFRVRTTVALTGRTVRVEAFAPTFTEALSDVGERLRQRLEHLRRRPRQRGPEAPTRPRASRPDPDLVRRKVFAPATSTLDEARFDADLLGHDFFVFVDDSTGRPAVLDRTGLDERVLDRPQATDIGVDGARELLRMTAAPFVFFDGPDHPDGAVVYLRADGHHGLLETE